MNGLYEKDEELSLELKKPKNKSSPALTMSCGLK